ncbi:MAG: hypothetical protein HYZ42_10655 [Bacteroidetes bacterium]|nr:hypothetical protein [Bacteroidota bacterium]
MNYTITHRKNLDTTKWNNAILNSSNSRVYALTPLLDAMCNSDWQALIINDFECVVPLPQAQKLWYLYTYPPYFLQQLGPFYEKMSIGLFNEIITIVTNYFSLGNIYTTSELFEYQDSLTANKSIKINQRNNYILNLNNSYKGLFESFSSNCKRNIKKSQFLELEEISIDQYLSFYLENKLYINSKIDLASIKKLVQGIHQNDELFKYKILAAYSENKICSAAIYLFYKNRITYISGGSSGIGTKNNAMFFIKNELIKQNENSHFILDFEGSNIPSIARFFEGFGSQKEIYLHLNFNNLNWPMNRLIK